MPTVLRQPPRLRFPLAIVLVAAVLGLILTVILVMQGSEHQVITQ